MSKWAFTITLMILVLSIVKGQSLYKEGFILNSPFDTLYGEIKYKSYNKASLRCIFRDSLGRETEFLPGDIFGYGIEDQLFFRSKKIGANKNNFLEVVYQGTMILYAYRDQRQRNYFYLENPTSGQFEILRQKTIRAGRKKTVIREFENVFKEMLPKSELIIDEIENVDYQHNALSNLLLAYDQRYASFQGRAFQGFKKRWPPRIAPFITLGQSRLTLNGFDDHSLSFNYGVGIKFQKEISRGTGRLYLDFDLSFHQESYEGAHFDKEATAFPETIISNGYNIAIFAVDLGVQGPYMLQNNVELERNVLTAPLNLKYFFPSEKWTFSIHGGLNFNYVLSQSGSIDGQVIQNEVVILGVNSPLAPNRFRPGIIVGTGIYLQTNGTWFLDVQHSPAWIDQGNANFNYFNVRLGYLFD